MEKITKQDILDFASLLNIKINRDIWTSRGPICRCTPENTRLECLLWYGRKFLIVDKNENYMELNQIVDSFDIYKTLINKEYN